MTAVGVMALVGIFAVVSEPNATMVFTVPVFVGALVIVVRRIRATVVTVSTEALIVSNLLQTWCLPWRRIHHVEWQSTAADVLPRLPVSAFVVVAGGPDWLHRVPIVATALMDPQDRVYFAELLVDRGVVVSGEDLLREQPKEGWRRTRRWSEPGRTPAENGVDGPLSSEL